MRYIFSLRAQIQVIGIAFVFVLSQQVRSEPVTNSHHTAPSITGMPADCFFSPHADYRVGSARVPVPSADIPNERRFVIDHLWGSEQQGYPMNRQKSGALLVPLQKPQPNCFDDDILK